MTERDIELRLKGAVDRAAPQDLEGLLSEIDGKGAAEMTTNTTNKNKKRARFTGLIAACLALIVLGGAGGLYYRQNYTVATVVSLDVNPSVELRVNRAERVMTCTGLNDEGRAILADMDAGRDLEGTKLDVAVNALVGAIVRAGYLDSLDSAILVSVEDSDAARGARLQAELVATVDEVLRSSANNADVLSQNMTADKALTEKAKEYGVSTGKATLIEQCIAMNPDLPFEGLAELSVEELRDLLRLGAPAMPIGRAKAREIALEYSGYDKLADSVIVEVDPELDEIVPIYDVEINYGLMDEDYEVDAFTGEVLRGRKDAASTTTPTDPGTTAPTTPAPSDPGTPAPTDPGASGVITPDEAFNAAGAAFSAAHPELSGYNVLDIETELKGSTYEVDFDCAGYDFEYAVDAVTGEVLREKTNYSAPQTQTPSTGGNTSTNDIGVDAAKAAALSHAGLSESQVRWLKAQRDYDDGRYEYELEFVLTDDTRVEYEYTIDAATGAILDHERDVDHHDDHHDDDDHDDHDDHDWDD